jgi:hypothetical protein
MAYDHTAFHSSPEEIEKGLVYCMNNRLRVPTSLLQYYEPKTKPCPTCGQEYETYEASYYLPSVVDDCDCGGWRVQDEFGEKVPLRCLKCGRKWDAEGKEVV